MVDELLHSDTYLGMDFSDNFKHWKYIRRYKKNGKWRYVYAYKPVGYEAHGKDDNTTVFSNGKVDMSRYEHSKALEKQKNGKINSAWSKNDWDYINSTSSSQMRSDTKSIARQTSNIARKRRKSIEKTYEKMFSYKINKFSANTIAKGKRFIAKYFS